MSPPPHYTDSSMHEDQHEAPLSSPGSAKSAFLEKGQELGTSLSSPVVVAEAITTQDTVLITSSGDRLPGVPIEDAEELNALRKEGEEEGSDGQTVDVNEVGNGEGKLEIPLESGGRAELKTELLHREVDIRKYISEQNGHEDADNVDGGEDVTGEVEIGKAPVDTQPLFPPVPLYGPPTLLRMIQCRFLQFTSGLLSCLFLLVVILGAVFTALPDAWRIGLMRLRGLDPDAKREFIHEEREREEKRGRYGMTEDHLLCDVRYYARRVGLDVREYQVTTEDGFRIPLQRIVDPKDLPETWDEKDKKKRYPLLLIHGLLQSSGAFCVNDEDSLAFFLCRVGYDVWLGNNRCHFTPEHMALKPNDPRMWAWNIRQLGILDLPAHISHVLSTTGFKKLGLIAHSQGTTQTFVALSKSQRPAIGEGISVFCALAPAVYAGPLIDKAHFKFMRFLPPSGFRVFFGIHSFIPLMSFIHKIFPRRAYGKLGYLVFNFLFGWEDKLWDRGLRDRFFIFSPTMLSSEAMRWWLGRECFAAKRCVLRIEDEEWFPAGMPPVACWVPENDGLVDGQLLLERLRKEKNVRLVHERVIPRYQHLDVLWAIDAVEKVGREVAGVVWKEVEREGIECRDVDLEWNLRRGEYLKEKNLH